MMAERTIDVRLKLLGPVIASAHPGTAAAAQSHDHLPGAMLLGAVAGQIYRTLSPEARRLAFHGGGVRFGDAEPIDAAGRPCRPVPFALHMPKDAGSWSPGERPPDALTNLAVDGARTPEVQWRQERGHHVSPDGRRVAVSMHRALKTAIDWETRRAAEAQLFGLEAIAAGQIFLARVNFGPDIDTALERTIRGVFDGGSEGGSAELRIGRSRASEYGRVQTSVLTEADTGWREAPQSDLRRIWFLSDAVLPPIPSDGETGRRPEDGLRRALGLSGEIVPELSFLRWRAHQPFNGHWRARGLERVTIARGSVLAVTDNEADAPRLARGLGLDREAGFGRIAVDATPLIATKPEFRAEPPSETPAAVPAVPGPAPAGIAAWIERRLKDSADQAAAQGAVEELVARIDATYDVAARMAGGTKYAVGPSAQQWGAVRSVLESDDTIRIHERLFGNNGYARDTNEDWARLTGRATTFSSDLEGLLSEHASPEARRRLIRAVREIAETIRKAEEVRA